MKKVKKIALFSCVENGGLTYLNHIKTLLPLLLPPPPPLINTNYLIDIFQPEGNFVGLSIEETKNYLNQKVIPLKITNNNIDFSPMFNYDIVFCNNQFMNAFPENILVVEISHAISAMPLVTVHYNMGYMSSGSDVILVFGNAYKHLKMFGMANFRKDYKHLSKVANENRSVFRNTYFCEMTPFKINNFFTENNYKSVNKNQVVIGILNASPTIVSMASLYNSIHLLVNEISRNFPNSKIIWKPFTSDFEIPNLDLETCFKELQKNVHNFSVERNLISSTDFYNQCDILISDGSSGGVSFFLNKAMPPIYYIPRNVIKKNVVVKNFVAIQNDKVLFAHSVKELIKQINFCINLTKQQRINYFNNYCEKDLFLNTDNHKVLQNIINSSFENFAYVDKNGEIFNMK